METEKMQEPEKPQIKKRGRPRKVQEGAAVAPVEIPEESTKPEKSKASRKPRKSAISTEALAAQLQGIHALAALYLGPDFTIDAQEAQLLADAMATVAKEYNISIGGKAGAWLGLLGACAMVYGPRLPAILAKAKAIKTRGKAEVHALTPS